MENMIDSIMEFVWSTFRNIRISRKRINNKPLLCHFALHKMRRGFGWSGDKRMDICIKCNFSIWYKDKIGNELIKNKTCGKH